MWDTERDIMEKQRLRVLTTVQYLEIGAQGDLALNIFFFSMDGGMKCSSYCI
jgi:hypothetical protein